MDESIYCKKCFKKCSGTVELKLHIESHKKEPRTSKRSTKSFHSSSKQLETKSSEEKDDDEPLAKSRKSDDQFVNLNEHSLERQYVECNVCQEICENESALRKHCEIHIYENHEKCGICSKVFRNAYSLQDHFKLSHSQSLYICEYCMAQFYRKKDFSQHVCSKSFPCNVCKKVFRSKDELLKHFFIHQSSQGSYLNFTSD